MGKKRKKLVDWVAEEQAKADEAKPMTRKEMEKSITKRKRPTLITSSHRGG